MNEPLHEIRFSLDISADEIIDYYSGAAATVWAVSDDGRSIHFPAAILRRFVTHSGVSGRFLLRHDAAGRFHSIERLR